MTNNDNNNGHNNPNNTPIQHDAITEVPRDNVSEPVDNTGVPETFNNTGVTEPMDNAGVPNENRSAQIDNAIQHATADLDDLEDTENFGYNWDTTRLIADNRKREAHIADLENDMDSKYGTRIRSGLQPRRKPGTVPTKFKGLKGADLEAELHAMAHKSLSLEEYANIYAAIHHSGVPDNKNYMTLDVVSTILTNTMSRKD